MLKIFPVKERSTLSPWLTSGNLRLRRGTNFSWMLLTPMTYRNSLRKRLIYHGPSRIHGTGAFAGADFHRDQHVPIPFTLVNENDPAHFDSIEGGMSPHRPFCYLNHADKPNCEVVGVAKGRPERLYLVLLKNVKRGTELTIDYGEEYWRLISTM